MSCKSCAETGASCSIDNKNSGDLQPCDGSCDGTSLRLAELAAHEPACAGNLSACAPAPVKHRDCTLIARDLVKAGFARLIKTDDGAALVFPRAGGEPMVVLVKDLCHCPAFNTHFGCERRDSTLSPSQLAAIVENYTSETLEAPGPADDGVDLVAFENGWFGIRAEQLGLSHIVCLQRFTATITVPGPVGGGPAVTTEVVPAYLGIAGEDNACGAPPDADTNDYVRVWNRPTRSTLITPTGLTIIAGCCVPKRCPCAWTPGRGGELIVFQLSAADLAIVEGDGVLAATAEVTRCAWGTSNPKGCCVEPVGNRLPSTTGPFSDGYGIEPRGITSGEYLPGLEGV